MNDTDAMYRTPSADLDPEANAGPKFFLPQPDAGKLKLLAILLWIELALEVPLFISSFMSGMDPERSIWHWATDVGLVICTALFVYVIWGWRSFLHARFNFYAADMWITLQVVMNLILATIGLAMGADDSVPLVVTYFIGMGLMGVCTLMTAIKLKPIATLYPYLRAYRFWLMVQSFLMISMIFFLLAVPAGFITGVLLALMLHHASRERREQDSQLV